MSGLIVGLVLRTPITDKFSSDAKFIATVYADHAWEDGTHAYPAVVTVATITGLSERTVQRYLRTLEEIGMLVNNGKGPRGTNRYDFPLVESADGSVRLAIRGGVSVTPPTQEEQQADSGDSVTSRQAGGGDRESGDRESGDTMVSPKQTTRPLKPNDDDEGASRPFQISESLQNELKDLGIFVSVWKDVANRMATSGWTEADITALIRWMLKTAKTKTKAATGFVTRVREGTKAPKEFYLNLRQQVVTEVADVDDPGTEIGMAYDDTITDPLRKAWRLVTDQLSGEMDRGAFVKYVRDIAPVHFENGCLQVGTFSDTHRDWLDSRLTKILENCLIGTIGDKVSVEFVVVEGVAVETEAA